MAIMTFSSREFNQDTSRAKKASSKGPVFITDRGKPAHVLLSMAEYQRLFGQRRSILTPLSIPGLADIEFNRPSSRFLTAGDLLLMFLLDKNVISELRKAGDGRADAHVIAWLSGVEQLPFTSLPLPDGIGVGLIRIGPAL